MEERIRELYSDSCFTAELARAKTFEDASSLFARHGVNISADTLEEIAANAPENENNSLSEEMLDNVSGGGILAAGACLLGGYIIGRIVVAITS